MKQYIDLLTRILALGEEREDRTGVGTRSLFGVRMEFDLRNGFPAVTTKKLYFKSVVAELLGFLRGYTNAKEFEALGTKIWNANAEADYWKLKAREPGDLGRMYGAQWRQWRSIGPDGNITYTDQINRLIDTIKTDPYSRRLLVTAWNAGELDQMCLNPCHSHFQVYISGHEMQYLDLLLYTRSNDFGLGTSFNVASYALLMHILASLTDKMPRRFVYEVGDAHIYNSHIEAIKEQITRKPLQLPTLEIKKRSSIEEFEVEDFALIGYEHHPAIKMEMAV